jgi:hypothetical protein
MLQDAQTKVEVATAKEAETEKAETKAVAEIETSNIRRAIKTKSLNNSCKPFDR